MVGISLFCLSTFSVLSMSESHQEVVLPNQLHPPVQATSKLEDINTNISRLKTAQDITKIKVESSVNKSIDTKKEDENPWLKSQIEERAAEKTDKDSRREPILPQGRVLMSQFEANTILAPPVVNETVRAINDEVRLKDDKELAVDDRVRTTTRKVSRSLDKYLYTMGGALKGRNENIGNITDLQKTNTTNLNLASISDKKETTENVSEGQENRKGAENKTTGAVPNRVRGKQDGVVDVVAAGADVDARAAPGNSDANSRKNEVKSKKYQNANSRKLLKDYLDSALKSNAQTIFNTSSVFREI